MYLKSKVIYKGLEERLGGSSIIEGREVKWEDGFNVLFDEIIDNKAVGGKTIVLKSNSALLQKFTKLNIYDNIELLFEVHFKDKNVKITLIDISTLDKKGE